MRHIPLTTALTLMFTMIGAGPACAGDVLAYLGPDVFGDNTLLTIVGDQQDNEIRITEDAQDHVWIEGLNGTTVNGKAADEVFASVDIFPGVSIDLGNGDDSVEYVFTGEQFRHATEFTTGNGDDHVTILASGQVGYLTIDTGNGNDTATVQLASDVVMQSFELNTGAGEDTVFYQADNSDGGAPFLIFYALIYTEEGNDEVHFDGYVASFSSNVFVSLGNGDDLLVGDSDSAVPFPGGVVALGGAGSDTVLNAAYFGSYALYLFETIVE